MFPKVERYRAGPAAVATVAVQFMQCLPRALPSPPSLSLSLCSLPCPPPLGLLLLLALPPSLYPLGEVWAYFLGSGTGLARAQARLGAHWPRIPSNGRPRI